MQQLLRYVPTIGICLYFLIFIYAASLYPGGTHNDPNIVGFDWVNNYWCHLDNEIAFNGMSNPARPFALGGTFIIAFTIAIFFYQFAIKVPMSKVWKYMVMIGGVGAGLLIPAIIDPNWHDTAILFASILGVLALIGLVKALFQNRYYKLIFFGFLSILLLVLNNVMLHTELWIDWLALVQKISFLIVLSWIALVSLTVGK